MISGGFIFIIIKKKNGNEYNLEAFTLSRRGKFLPYTFWLEKKGKEEGEKGREKEFAWQVMVL